ncbi:hypothetical protein STSO111631_23930 [Stackebrandtia soli]
MFGASGALGDTGAGLAMVDGDTGASDTGTDGGGGTNRCGVGLTTGEPVGGAETARR